MTPVLQTGTTLQLCRISFVEAAGFEPALAVFHTVALPLELYFHEVAIQLGGRLASRLFRQPASCIGAFTNITARTKGCLWPSTTLQLWETLVLPLP